MDSEKLPKDDVKAASTRRQRTTVYFGCGLLVSYAVALLLLPSEKLSFPLRLAFAAGNLVAAATLWLIAKQSGKKP